MPVISVSVALDDLQQKTIQRLAADYNADMNVALTPVEFFRTVFVAARIDQETARLRARDGLTKQQVYQLLTPEDKALVDGVFAKYGA